MLAKIISRIPTQEDITRTFGDGQSPNSVAQVKNCREAYFAFTIPLAALSGAAFLILAALMLTRPPAIPMEPNSQLWPFLALYAFMAASGMALIWYGHRRYQTEIAEAHAAAERRMAQAGAL